MEDMTFPELIIIVKGMEYVEVEAWNRTRHLMLSMISPYMKKKMTPKELLPLIIDDDGREKTTEISNEDVEWFNNFVEHYKKKEE